MFKRYISLPAIGFAAALALPAAAQDANTVVATVNDTEITLGHMIVAMSTLPQQYQQLPDSVLYDGILNQLVQQSLLAQSFEGELPTRAQVALENETRSVTAGEAVELLLADALTPEALQAAYDARFEGATPGTEYNASHILVENEETALAIKAEIEAGADFAATAQEKSTGPSGPNGGALGWFGSGAMVPSFEAAVIALEVGAVSDPVQTQFGWHVIKLNETRTAEQPALDEIRPELEEQLRAEALAARIDALTEAGEVVVDTENPVDPALLRNLSLLD
ncbi:MAG: peptidylprolyl isomerase [Pseudomonadota bacterium]